ncbi:Tripeptidyl-peptidase sed3 [Diplonema papillatum]|nr:Tripeptidyl-peptidase sed3 [Diplonema papillatum]
MRSVAFAALLVAASAGLTQVHKPATIPQGWTVEDGEVPKGHRFKVHIGMKRSNQAKLSALVSDVSNPQGSRYLQYPTYEEMGDLVRPPKENTQKVLSWLASHGAAVEAVHPHGDYIHAAATVEQIEAMAHGKFVRYSHSDLGHIVRLTSGVHVDSDVAAVIDTFTGFEGFPLPYKKKVQKSRKGADALGDVTPTSFRSTYGITSLPAGSQRNIQAIAQFEGAYVDDSELSEFCKKYDNGTQCTISKYIGKNSAPGSVVSMVDTEYIMSIGNRTETWVYSYPNVNFCADLGAFGSAVTSESTFPYSISISYGIQLIDYCETAIMTRFAADVEKMGGMGITVMISSGDHGSGVAENSGNLSPAFPASVPHCVAVGGTFFVNGKDGEEQATTQFGSGGGFSYDFPVQDYQKDGIAEYLKTAKLPNAPYATGRGTPDVSALAEQFTIIAGNATVIVASNSCSTPSFAGIVSLLNSVCLAAGGKTLGFMNPLMYQNPSMFTDVTKGTNAIGPVGSEAGWEAIKGWDAATGLGTPNFPAMLTVVRTACAKAGRRQ